MRIRIVFFALRMNSTYLSKVSLLRKSPWSCGQDIWQFAFLYSRMYSYPSTSDTGTEVSTSVFFCLGGGGANMAAGTADAGGTNNGYP